MQVFTRLPCIGGYGDSKFSMVAPPIQSAGFRAGETLSIPRHLNCCGTTRGANRSISPYIILPRGPLWSSNRPYQENAVDHRWLPLFLIIEIKYVSMFFFQLHRLLLAHSANLLRGRPQGTEVRLEAQRWAKNGRNGQRNVSNMVQIVGIFCAAASSGENGPAFDNLLPLFPTRHAVE